MCGECRGGRASNVHCINLSTFSALHEVPAVRGCACVCVKALAQLTPRQYHIRIRASSTCGTVPSAPQRPRRPGAACVHVHVRARAHDEGRCAQIVTAVLSTANSDICHARAG